MCHNSTQLQKLMVSSRLDYCRSVLYVDSKPSVANFRKFKMLLPALSTDWRERVM